MSSMSSIRQPPRRLGCSLFSFKLTCLKNRSKQLHRKTSDRVSKVCQLHNIQHPVNCDNHIRMKHISSNHKPHSLFVSNANFCWRRDGVKIQLTEQERQKLEKQNFCPHAKHARLYPDQLQAFTEGSLIALGPQQREYQLLYGQHPTIGRVSKGISTSVWT